MSDPMGGGPPEATFTTPGKPPVSCLVGVIAAALLGMAIPPAVFGQSVATTPQSGPQAGASQNTGGSEVSTEESHPNFELHVQHNEVLVRAVVRDAKGQAVTNLQKDDFRIFDNRKPQVITHFALETSGAAARTPPGAVAAGATTQPGTQPASMIILPHRFMALFFDDIHIEFGDLARTRDAADHYLATNLKPGDRAAIYTASGQNQLDFTDDREKLHDALLRLRQHPLPSGGGACPHIMDYEAYEIAEQNDPSTLQVAETDAIAECCGGSNNPPCPQADPNYLGSISRQILSNLEVSSRLVFQGLEGVCRRMAVLQGQRSIVLLSPGFFTDTETYDLQQAIDRALRENVVIGTLDARGLYTDIPGGDASQQTFGSLTTMASKTQVHSAELLADAGVLASLADQTGGVYFHNSNDYGEGLRRTGAFPDAYYVLAFAPQDLKPDGRMHTLKVSLASNPDHFTLQARKAYFAPKKAEDAATVAKEELEQMAFSQEELQGIPIEIHTQFFKPSTGAAKLSVVTHVDLSHVRFRKAEGRNLNNLTLMTVVFDQGGDYVTGQQKSIQFRLLDATLTKLTETGLNVKSTVDVKPGTYLVREVVQDSEGGLLSAQNSQVEIP
ncbi:MAG TPA: VWA domain-containing protein [Terriglobia bacterium]